MPIKAILAYQESELSGISLEDFQRERVVGGFPAHPLQHLDEGMRILAKDNTRDDSHLLSAVGANQLEVPAFKKWWFLPPSMIHARVERAADGHNCLVL